MKLFHKIFLCFALIFGLTFQSAGYLLLDFSYENAIEQGKRYAFQEFCHNQYLLQSLLYLEPEALAESESLSRLAEEFTVPAALYRADGTFLFSSMDTQPAFPSFTDAEEGRLHFQILEREDKSCVYVYDRVEQGETDVWLVTETDISGIVDAQRGMIAYFQRLYLLFVCIGIPVSYLLSKMLTDPIKALREAAKRIAQGRYSDRIRAGGRDEIGELAASFNQMAEKIEEKIADLSAAAREKEDFAANLAHELKTPLTSVIGYADRLYQRSLEREEVKSAAAYILHESMRLEALSRKLMDLFVLKRQSFPLEELSVKEIFAGLKEGMDAMCGERGVKLHIELQEGSIRAEYDLFETVVQNLLDNALKAECQNILIAGEREKSAYRLTIRDDGRGIPPGELGRVTEAFYMVDKSRARKQHGAGLGLALVRRIADVHGARLLLESDGKTGCAVRLDFPLPEGERNG